MARCSGCRCTGAASGPRVATTNATRSKPPATGRPRPPVIVYGRTTGPASSSSQEYSCSDRRCGTSWSWSRSCAWPSGGCAVPTGSAYGGSGRSGSGSARIGRGRGRPRRRRQVLPHPDDQHGHLVRDVSDVGLRVAEDGQAGTLPGGGDEEERLVHLDDGLAYLPAAEVSSRTPGEALETG